MKFIYAIFCACILHLVNPVSAQETWDFRIETLEAAPSVVPNRLECAQAKRNQEISKILGWSDVHTDDRGRIIAFTDKSGHPHELGYDDEGRISYLTFPREGIAKKFHYSAKEENY